MSKKYCSMLLSGTLTMMVASVMMMSDSVIAGAFIGSDAVAGITLVTPLYSLAVFFGSLISIGIPVLYATEMGKFNKKRADHAFGFGVLMSIVVGVILFLWIIFFGDSYLRGYLPEKEVLTRAQEYLFWMAYVILTMPMQMLLANMVNGDGDETISNIANVTQGVGNIALSVILCPVMGNRGIGLASFIFNIVSILILLVHFTKKSNSLRWNLHFSFSIMKDVLRYSVIDSSSYLFLSVFTASLNAFISAQFGAEYLILASAITLCREFQLVFDGIGVAVGPIFGIYVGEQNHTGLRSSFSLANKTAMIEGFIVTLVLVFIAPFAPSILNVEDPVLASCVVTGVRLTALGSTFVSLLYLLTSYYLVIGKILLGVIVCALRDVVLSVALAVMLGKVFGVTGMYIGIAAAPAIAYVLLMLYLTVRYGKKDCPLLLSEVPGGEKCFLFHLFTDPDKIIDTQRKVEALLKEHNVDKETVGCTMLLIEEMYTIIRQKNNNKSVLAECTVILYPDGVQIISKDDGVSFDMTDDDIITTSLAGYTLSAFLEQKDFDNRHLTAMSFNCSSLFVKYPQS